MSGHQNRETNQALWALGRYTGQFHSPPEDTQWGLPLREAWVEQHGPAKEVLAYIKLGETPQGRAAIFLELHRLGVRKASDIAHMTGASPSQVQPVLNREKNRKLRLPIGVTPWWYGASSKAKKVDPEIVMSAWQELATKLYGDPTARPDPREYKAVEAAVIAAIRKWDKR